MWGDFIWSFSKLSAYCHCPRSFKLQYIDRVPQEDNAFSEYGTLCHSLLEEWAKGELLPFELADAYRNRYNDVVKHYFPAFPPGIGLNYYQSGHRYFAGFEGIGDPYQIMAVEDRFTVHIGGIRYAGIVDLLLRNRETGDLVVLCHKSKSLKGMKKDFAFSIKQLYLYTLGIEQRYGQLPALLRFNLFRSGRMMDEFFCKEEYENAKRWLLETVDQVKNDSDWKPSLSEFHCTQICSSYPYCEAAQAIS